MAKYYLGCGDYECYLLKDAAGTFVKAATQHDINIAYGESDDFADTGIGQDCSFMFFTTAPLRQIRESLPSLPFEYLASCTKVLHAFDIVTDHAHGDERLEKIELLFIKGEGLFINNLEEYKNVVATHYENSKRTENA